MPQENVNIGFRSYRAMVQTHQHPFFQMVLPSRGALELDIGGYGGRVDRNGAAFIGAGERHAFSALTTTNRFLVVDIPAPHKMPPETLDGLERLAEGRYTMLTPAAQYLMGYVEHATVGVQSAASGFPRIAALWLDLLVASLCQECNFARRDPTDKALARATAFLNRFFDQPITMADIARVAGLGASRLYEVFQERLGTTPRGYLREVRCRHALALLASTPLPIAEIAVRTGHADQSVLTRRLHQVCGTTPAAYRRTAAARRSKSGETAKSGGELIKKR